MGFNHNFSDLEQTTFWDLTFTTKVNLQKHVEIVQHDMENQEGELSHVHPEVETEHSNTRVTKSLSCDTDKKGFGTLT